MFSQVSRRMELAFEDMGVLKDTMDKRADSLLKKAWDSTFARLKPAMASTVVARNLECWIETLKRHIEACTSRKELLESFPLMLKAVKYMADASAESVKMSVSSSALVNSARRAIWLKTWTQHPRLSYAGYLSQVNFFLVRTLNRSWTEQLTRKRCFR